MNQATPYPSLQTALRYPFQGEGWQGRFAVGVGLLLAGFFVPVLPVLFVYGYLLRIMRAAISASCPSSSCPSGIT